MVFHRPRAIMGFGGYPSIPAVLAGRVLGIPTALHEQNAILGRANRLLGRFVKHIAVSFRDTKFTEQFRSKVSYTGNPVRQSMITLRDSSYQPSNLKKPFFLLIIGGSQGAGVFSTIIPQALRQLPQELRCRLVVWQQCRPEFLEMTKGAYHQSDISVELQPFFEDVDQRLRDAHLVIGRAGASTIAELTVVGRPAMLVPFPFATDNHQKDNAMSLEEKGAAWVILEKDFIPSKVQEILETVMMDNKKLKMMATQMHALGQPDAAVKLARIVESM